MARSDRKVVDQVLVFLGIVVLGAFIVVGCFAWYGYTFATGQVHDELAAQKIYFPQAGSPGFDAAEYPTLQQYAGQLVDNGPKAKAYANDYIGHHLDKIAGGKTYAEVSALAKADPTNATLAAQKASLFQGETLRGMLLGDGYAYWTFGEIARIGSLASFAGAAIMALLVAMGLRRIA
jgi:hypothetical protein